MRFFSCRNLWICSQAFSSASSTAISTAGKFCLLCSYERRASLYNSCALGNLRQAWRPSSVIYQCPLLFLTSQPAFTSGMVAKRTILSYLGILLGGEYPFSYSVSAVISGRKEIISLPDNPSGLLHSNSNALRNSSPILPSVISAIEVTLPPV